MPPVAPPDHPSMFPLGFHHLTMGDIEQVCVDLFPLSTSRAVIFSGLVTFVETLEAAKVPGQLWIDGSFLTEKIDPKDVDVILKVDGAIYNSGTLEQRQAIDWVNANQKLTLRCESYALMQYPIGHFLHDEGLWWYSYWHKQWGFSREEDPKGIVVLTLGAGGTHE
jgi:hypothetical protein